MLSRVANSVYWLSRYIERAENVARFIDVNYNLTLGEGMPIAEQWAPLVYTTGDEKLFQELHGRPSRESVLQFLAFDARNPNSILACVKSARENARTIRDSITGPMWEHINRFYLLVKSQARAGLGEVDPMPFCDSVKNASHALIGTAYATMAHGEAWHFLRLGRMLERADKTSRIVDVQYYLLLPDAKKVGSSLDVLRWSALLRSASALEMYRRVHGRIEPQRVAEFLVLDRCFPRAVRFCLAGAQDSVNEITGSRSGTFRIHTEQLLGRLRSELDYASIEDVIQRGLHEFVDDLQVRLNNVGNAIHKDFFTIPARSA